MASNGVLRGEDGGWHVPEPKRRAWIVLTAM
jgi:hypothetical protein